MTQAAEILRETADRLRALGLGGARQAEIVQLLAELAEGREVGSIALPLLRRIGVQMSALRAIKNGDAFMGSSDPGTIAAAALGFERAGGARITERKTG